VSQQLALRLIAARYRQGLHYSHFCATRRPRAQRNQSVTLRDNAKNESAKFGYDERHEQFENKRNSDAVDSRWILGVFVGGLTGCSATRDRRER
jgi:hypothetical protein